MTSVEHTTGATDAAESLELPEPKRLQELLFAAARMGRVDVIPGLIQAGVDIEARDERGYSALIVASYNGQAEATTLLLSLGAEPDGADSHRGNTALMGIAFKGHADIARILVDGGSNVNARNFAGQTALMTAVLFNQSAIVEMLLAAGADAEAADEQGNTVVTLARQQGHAAMVTRFVG